MEEKTNCEGCLYRQLLAAEGEHITRDDGCDKVGTQFCKNMNDPGFQAWVNGGQNHGKES